MILLVDNYDSFSYNVYQLVGSVDPDIRVIRNDELTVEEIGQLHPDHIILSPGPGQPKDAGVCEDLIHAFAGKVPILGICLGHQAICEAFGAKITYADQLMHGKQSVVKLDTGSRLFKDMPQSITAARYHSLAAEPGTMPECLQVIAQTREGEIMAVQHREYPVYGVQVHPESVLTPVGKSIMENVRLGYFTEKDKHIVHDAIIKLSRKEDIGYEMAKAVMHKIMSGEATDVQKSAYLTALSMKGETIEEITGSAEMMRAHALKLETKAESLEIVGTGGDGSNSFNISTTSAMVISAAGVPVAKHGNRAASSKSGAADCLEALGVKLDLEPEQSREILEEIGLCFLFAQKYHTAMKYVGPIRRELGIRTVFNILGPLTNPACPSYIVLGVFDESLLETMAQVLIKLGIKRGVVVYGQDKLDEISASAPTSVCEIGGGDLKKYVIQPEDFGLERCRKEELVGGTPAENAEITKAVLQGERGARRTAVLMNAGAALYVAGKADSMEEGVKLAAEMIDSGRAMKQLEKFIELTNRVKKE